MYSITKTFPEYPAAHRQPFHGGHCAQIHGHNWTFVVELSSPVVDVQGFVFDFGHFGPVKEFLREKFDHTLLLQKNDPQLETLLALQPTLARIVVLDSVSCEGLAKYLFDFLTAYFEARVDINYQLRVESVTVLEDSKNTATYRR